MLRQGDPDRPDARNVRKIVLLSSINSMIEFKQIVSRGTRLFEGKHISRFTMS